MMAELHRYMSAGQRVEMIYMDGHGRISKRIIQPYTIEGDLVKAYCLHRRAPRCFSVDHILAVLPVQ